MSASVSSEVTNPVHKVYLSLGSNVEAEKNLKFALEKLRQKFSSIEISPVYESEAVGFAGENFLNLVASIETKLSVNELSLVLRDIENQGGRDRSKPRFSSRSIDIDILTFDDYVGDFDGIELPRDEILKNAFVLLPLSDLAPAELHPLNKKSYQELWQEFDKGSQQLWQIQINL